MLILNSQVMRNAILSSLFILVFIQGLNAQDTTGQKKELKNSLRFNVTNPVIFGSKSLIFGYERVLNKNRTFSINVGQAGLPEFKLFSLDSLRSLGSSSERGLNVSVDFRFYLSNQNRNNAPRGVYIGPYFTYFDFERKNTWSLKSTSGGTPKTVETKTGFEITGIGAELGYQFVFWRRVSLDMILAGPGIANYKVKASIETNLTDEDKKKFYDALNQALAERIPGYSRVIDEGEFERRGSTNVTSFGFRYMIMVGLRF